MTPTSSNVMRNKKKNIVLFTDSIQKALPMGEINYYINGGKVHLKLKTKTNQLNHHVIPNLEEHQYDTASIHVGINNLLKEMPNNVTVESICNASLIAILLRCLCQVLSRVPK